MRWSRSAARSWTYVEQRFDGLALTIGGPAQVALLVGDLVDAFQADGTATVGPPAERQMENGKVDAALLGRGVLMVLCCAVGPAVIGAVAGSVVGGWLGIACAIILADAVGPLRHRRSRAC